MRLSSSSIVAYVHAGVPNAHEEKTYYLFMIKCKMHSFRRRPHPYACLDTELTLGINGLPHLFVYTESGQDARLSLTL